MVFALTLQVVAAHDVPLTCRLPISFPDRTQGETLLVEPGSVSHLGLVRLPEFRPPLNSSPC